MKHLQLGLDLARASGAEYAEVQFVQQLDKDFQVSNGIVSVQGSQSQTLAVRVLVQGRWGFASGPFGGKAVVQQLVAAAVEGAAAAPGSRRATRLSACFPVQAQWAGSCSKDPFAMTETEIVEYLQAADANMNIEGIELRRSFLSFCQQHKLYLNSEGTNTDQTFFYSGGGIAAFAGDGWDLQQRSWPCQGGSWAGRGFEYIEELDLPGNAATVAKEALALAKAPSAPSIITDLIIQGGQLTEHLYHTCGQLAQLGSPCSLPPNRAGQHRFGSPLLTILADGTLSGGAGSYGYDEEGIKAQSFPIVEDGRFANFLTGREQAAQIGRFSTGAMRSTPFSLPQPRVSNLVIQPGYGRVADLAAEIDNGILIDNSRGFSPDPDCHSFITQAEAGWLIVKGKIRHMVKNPIYSGNSTEFWSSCDGVGKEMQLLGQKKDDLLIGFSLVPIRVRGVKVGI